jgi:hypothetical protein
MQCDTRKKRRKSHVIALKKKRTIDQLRYIGIAYAASHRPSVSAAFAKIIVKVL